MQKSSYVNITTQVSSNISLSISSFNITDPNGYILLSFLSLPPLLSRQNANTIEYLFTPTINNYLFVLYEGITLNPFSPSFLFFSNNETNDCFKDSYIKFTAIHYVNLSGYIQFEM